MRRSIRFSWAVLCAVGIVSGARADDKDVVDYREHIMNTLNEQAAAVGQILSMAVPDDNLTAHLEALSLTASIALKSFEPKVPGGEAKPVVWSNWPEFSKRMTDFAQKIAQAAQTARAGGREEVMTNIADALSCKGCHDVYREEKKK